MLFWFLLFLMILALVLGVGWGLFGLAEERKEIRSESLNSIVYQDQLDELQEELVAKKITKEEYKKEVEEIERRVLQEAEQQNGTIKTGPKKLTFLVLLFLIPAVALSIYLKIGNPSLVDYSPKLHGGATVTEDNTLKLEATQEVDEKKLEQYLKESPKDMRGWLQYSRLLGEQGRWKEALNAMDKAFELSPEKAAKEPALITERAFLMFQTQDPQMKDRILSELRRAVEINPNELDARKLAGVVAYTYGDYQGAADAWSKLLDFYEPGTKEASQLIDAISEAKNKAMMNGFNYR